MVGSIDDFLLARFNKFDIPADLDVLLRATKERHDFFESNQNPLFHFGADLLWAEQTYPLLDHTYLNDLDRADLNIMANVAAMQDTGRKLKFFLQKDDDSLLGYWQPDENVPLNKCDLFWLDTEGQYSIAEGDSFATTLAYNAQVNNDLSKLEAISQAFATLGVEIPQIDQDEIFSQMNKRSSAVSESPQAFRKKRYEQYKPQIEQTVENVAKPSVFQKIMRFWRGKK